MCEVNSDNLNVSAIRMSPAVIAKIHTRNELASLAHSFYTCLKHQLMLASIIVLLSSTLDYVACMMLDPQLYYIITF